MAHNMRDRRKKLRYFCAGLLNGEQVKRISCNKCYETCLIVGSDDKFDIFVSKLL